ncbi:MAG: Uma2 family endonuclease [Methyloprofundus sp.]|nr:Uma2 family endonuclease [Methyloprofundus sp.]
MLAHSVELQITENEYLDAEQDAQVRHELIDGSVYAMTGASDKHNKVAGNMFAELRNDLKFKSAPCTAYINDMKVKAQNNFYYPDVMVVCDNNDKESEFYKTKPTIVIEVLSPSTRRIDKTIKRLAYQSLSTLQEYVLIEQDKAEIEVFTRSSGWQAEYYYLGDSITFVSIGVTVQVEDIYYQVNNDDVLAYRASS